MILDVESRFFDLYTLYVTANRLGRSGFFGRLLKPGGGFLYWALRLYAGTDPTLGMTTFKYSIVYLLALFAIMLADHYLVEPALIGARHT